ncbi:hypothetical protein CFP56_036527 [Quercus suber]|uniref:Uncharacterized protein n=1 Tax=Quercus suber TaxID=58331 RepID=A0AAW0J7F2_QUESU
MVRHIMGRKNPIDISSMCGLAESSLFYVLNLQGHSLMRLQPVGSPGSPSPNTSQNMQTGPQAVTHQPQITRVQGSGNQKPSSLAMVQPNTVQAVARIEQLLRKLMNLVTGFLAKEAFMS